MKNKTNFLRLPLLFMGVFLFFAISCDKDDDNDINDNDINGEECVDADGNVYQTVVIGNQEWMAENLAYAPSSGNYWAYDNDDANVEVYGYLYDWQTALNVCPTGWHLPSDEEWTELTDYLGDNAGGKLKATGTIEAGTGLWVDPNTGATNETGFTARPGGYHRGSNGTFYNVGSSGHWWSATEFSTNYAWSRRMNYNQSNVHRSRYNKELGYSVRCLRD